MTGTSRQSLGPSVADKIDLPANKEISAAWEKTNKKKPEALSNNSTLIWEGSCVYTAVLKD